MNFVFVLGILANLIDLKADLEGPLSLRDLLFDRSKLLIPKYHEHRVIHLTGLGYFVI
jgi:hypothetical protein